jgi:hypothetical protein
MTVLKAVIRIIIGAVFGACSFLFLTPAFAAFTSKNDSMPPIVMIAFVLIGGALCFFAPNIRRALGRGFLALGSSVFVLPISAFLLSGRVASEMVNTAEKGSEFVAVGAGLGGVVVTGVATFVGLIIGSVLLLIGLVLSLGGQREVIIVGVKKTHQPTLNRES